jgi:hypothetical protein
MEVYGEFFTNFMGPFFEGLAKIFSGIGEGIVEMFNVVNYASVVSEYKNDLTGVGVVIVIISVLVLLAIFVILFYLIYRAIRTFIKYRRNVKKEDMLVEEIDSLNNEISKLKRQNEKFAELTNEFGDIEYNEDGSIKGELKEGESRFFKLSQIDNKYNEYKPEVINNSFSLNELCEQFRNFAASRLGLYYDIKIIRLFIASLASNKLIILEGISGTGKTSLAYAFGQFLNNETTVASVQPSWRDSTEIFGYFNEFTKKFNETEILEKMYEASYSDEVFITLLDEMNISRVEYYFAEMLSILELPNKDNWQVELVPNVWPNDPVKLDEGRLHIPENMWYVGTINNDDSTFMITDKVYDRAMPIAIDDKYAQFTAPDTEPLKVSYKYLNGLFESASKNHSVSEENMEKIGQLDRYVIDHFRLAFGNRIVKQLREFIPAFVACGGEELDAVDYLLAHKILRKFEQLNLAYIKDEIDGLISYIDKLFGTDRMKECKSYLLRLKKTI